jgi:hypothetical protein
MEHLLIPLFHHPQHLIMNSEHFITIPRTFMEKLVKLPETGMGFQQVKVFLRDGRVLKNHKVFNGSELLLELQETANPAEIIKIEPEN